ncbi:hypothetical protein GQX73_g2979 [Xylaria multiplex]|uniref:Uncharacterized protein n=1 Tax=Xylaria multiplex TaxID=323545 RepID=A0A7C8MX46_9PEZI|nr:hypothetical protein GQX73_g2979 [Xylaria multiplex]
MKFQKAALIGLVATAASAQEETQIGPFTLHIKGTKCNSTIDGYAKICRAGVGFSGLCYSDDKLSNTSDIANPFKYNFKYTGFNKVDESEVGTLVWNQPVRGHFLLFFADFYSIKASFRLEIVSWKFIAVSKRLRPTLKMTNPNPKCLQYTDQGGNPAWVPFPMGLSYQTTSNVAAPIFGYEQNIQTVFMVGFDSKGGLFGYNYIDDSEFDAGQPLSDFTPKAYCEYILLAAPYAMYLNFPSFAATGELRPSIRRSDDVLIRGFDPICPAIDPTRRQSQWLLSLIYLGTTRSMRYVLLTPPMPASVSQWLRGQNNFANARFVVIYSKSLGANNYDIANPRRYAENVQKDEKLDKAVMKPIILIIYLLTKNKILRCEAAAANGQETLNLFVASLIAANYAGVPVETINTLAGVYLGSRVLYNITYIFLQENRSFAPLRSLVWNVGIVSWITLFIKAGNRL